jgi:hypothetical protein
MAARGAAGRTSTYAQRLLDNEYVQEQLAAGVESLRAAYKRASKRRVEPARDEKVREQIRQAAASFTEAANAIRTGRRKPKRKRGRRVLVVLGAGAAAAGAALASSEELRHKVLGGGPSPVQPSTPATEAGEPQVAAE